MPFGLSKSEREHNRKVKEAEAEAFRKRELELAPKTGKLKAEARERKIRERASKGGRAKGIASGVFGVMQNMSNYTTPATEEILGGGPSRPAGKKKRAKDPYEDFMSGW